MEKLEPLCTVDGNVKWRSHCGKEYGGSSKNLKIELSYDPVVLGIYPEELKSESEKDTSTPMFIATIFITIAKILKQPKSPSWDRWIDKCGIYIQWNIISFKKKGNFDTCYNIDKPWRHVKYASHKGAITMWSHLYEVRKSSKNIESRTVVVKDWRMGEWGFIVWWL